MGTKGFKFMQKDNSIFSATHALFDEQTFLRAKSKNGSQNKNKLIARPPGIMDQEEITIPTNPTLDNNHKDDEQELSSSEEEGEKSVDEEDEVMDELNPKSEPSDNQSSKDHSRESGSDPFDEKSNDDSNDGYETDHRLQDDLDLPEEPVEEPQLHRSSRIEKEIRTEKGWQNAVAGPFTKLVSKQVQHIFKEDLKQLLKEGGNKYIQYLLAQAVEIEKNPRDYQYQDILALRHTKPIAFEEWQTAMKAEIQALNDHNVWELVDLPKDQKPIKCRWVYNVKTDGHKQGHLVMKGFSQIPGIDFEETFSPVTHFETVRLLLALSALEDWEIKALDVKTAFLYGNLDEELYMEQPEGFIKQGQEKKVYHLLKALYGLKQAAIAWNKQADKSLKSLRFERCLSDTGVYTQTKNNSVIVVVLYVDDVLFMGNNKTFIMEKKSAFMKKWECRDLGPIVKVTFGCTRVAL
ncbi:hypothetical protein AX14_003534, partial [Amanita brunnescens Koide BX004]